MTDPRDVEYEEEETPVHVQIRAAISMNSVGTLNVAIERFPSIEEATEYLNTEALDTQGNVAYHMAARGGKSDIIDELLDIEGFECDPLNYNGETPLHSAIRFVNEARENWSDGLALVEMMLEAGSDNRIRNKQGKTAADLVDQHFELKQLLKGHTFEEYDESGNPAPEPEKVESGYLDIDEAEDGEDDENSVYSGSDSEEEKEWKRRHEEKAKKAAS